MTYWLLWGEIGKSNALYIVAGFGLELWIFVEVCIVLVKVDVNVEVDVSGVIVWENCVKLVSVFDEECDV